MNVDNIEIELGVQNWKGNGMTSGDVRIKLPNGTTINIRCATKDETGKVIQQEVSIHRLRETEITVHQHGNTLTKKTEHGKLHSWTEIREKVTE